MRSKADASVPRSDHYVLPTGAELPVDADWRITTRNATPLRSALLVDAVVFLGAALFNMGLRVPLGFADLGFSDPVWQAGTGEAIIGVTLLAAGLTAGARLSWVGFWMSALGIAIGLTAEDYDGKLTSDQLERLRQIFPEGVCDYGKPSQNASPFLGTWLSFGGR